MSVDTSAFRDYGRDFEYKKKQSRYEEFKDWLISLYDRPVTWFRETVVVPNRKEYNWYHRRFPRVPTVDQCYQDDPVCIFEADEQLRRDMKVDGRIIAILRKRFENCVNYHGRDDGFEICDHLKVAMETAITNYFIKYGELGFTQKSVMCLMKQKHRMIWERRYGPVGSGMNPIKYEDVEAEAKKC